MEKRRRDQNEREGSNLFFEGYDSLLCSNEVYEEKEGKVMGRITDIAIAIFVIIVGLILLDRMNITLPMLESAFRHFFFSSGSSTGNTTSGFILGLTATNSKMKLKMENHRIQRIREHFITTLRFFKSRKGD